MYWSKTWTIHTKLKVHNLPHCHRKEDRKRPLKWLYARKKLQTVQKYNYLFSTSPGIAAGGTTEGSKAPGGQVVSSQAAQRERVWTGNARNILWVSIARTVHAIGTVRLNWQRLADVCTRSRSTQLVAAHHQLLTSTDSRIYTINVPHAVMPGECLQCFDAVGWVAGRASGL